MPNRDTAGIAIVGCGYVADSYRQCLALHDGLRLAGVYDRDPERLAAFRACWSDAAYHDLPALLSDSTVDIVVNLTDPENHVSVTEAAIAAGKHVYTEKPLALTTTESARLRDLARAGGVRLSAAPCNLMAESIQTAWAAIRRGDIGRVVLVYAELDDGLIHKTNYRSWASKSGRFWPARGEFEVGCTFEHAGYAIGPLVAMLGPVAQVSAFSSVLIPDKLTEPPLHHPAPDFSSGCLQFESGPVARITNSIVAPYDHRMRIVGDEGTIEITEAWAYASPVVVRRPARDRIGRYLERTWPAVRGERLKPVRSTPFRGGNGRPTMDFMRGVAELAQAIQEGRPSRLDEDLAVHVTEVTEMLQHPERFPQPAAVTSRVGPIQPMDWARA